ncbi:hypothetical protein EDD17DRAFT_618479 [Pisolithus thermaeus]|nr:hypothetical protein EV401DRAFT_1005910 [Pisolithus croceorrhizus]KAI6168375.1 hypothetical protein EDD17DRAFT_618479 [Pisolithus thermaeus]
MVARPASALLLVLGPDHGGTTWKTSPIDHSRPSLTSIRSPPNASQCMSASNGFSVAKYPCQQAPSRRYRGRRIVVSTQHSLSCPFMFTRTIASASTRHILGCPAPLTKQGNHKRTARPVDTHSRRSSGPVAVCLSAMNFRKSPKNATGDGAMPSLQ